MRVHKIFYQFSNHWKKFPLDTTFSLNVLNQVNTVDNQIAVVIKSFILVCFVISWENFQMLLNLIESFCDVISKVLKATWSFLSTYFRWSFEIIGYENTRQHKLAVTVCFTAHAHSNGLEWIRLPQRSVHPRCLFRRFGFELLLLLHRRLHGNPLPDQLERMLVVALPKRWHLCWWHCVI